MLIKHDDERTELPELSSLRRQYNKIGQSRQRVRERNSFLLVYWHKMIKDLENEKTRVGKELRLATSSACGKRDENNCQKLEDRLIEKANTKIEIEKSKQGNLELDISLKKWEERVQLQRVKSSKLRFNQSKSSASASFYLKRLSVLEGRLNREESKFNSTLANNAAVRALIDTLVNEKHKYEFRYTILDKKWFEIKSQISNILDLSLSTYEQTADMKSRNKSMKEKFETEYNQFSSDRMELEVDINSKEKWRSFMGDVRNTRWQHKMEQKQRDRDLMMQMDIERNEKLIKLEKAWGRIVKCIHPTSNTNTNNNSETISKQTSNSTQSTLKDLKDLKETEEGNQDDIFNENTSYISSYESSVEKILEKSKRLEEEHFASFNENNYQKEQIRKLEKELSKIKSQIKDEKKEMTKIEQFSELQNNSIMYERAGMNQGIESYRKKIDENDDMICSFEKSINQIRQKLNLTSQPEDSDHDQLLSELANIDEYVNKVLAGYFHNRSDGKDEWVYFQDPSLLKKGTEKPSKISSEVWNKRKSVVIGPDVIEKTSVILDPASTVDIRKGKNQKQEIIPRRSSLGSSVPEEVEKVDITDLNNVVPDNKMLSIEELNGLANKHYRLRKDKLLAQKTRRRSTLRRLSLYYSK
jgi:hypothetical protein